MEEITQDISGNSNHLNSTDDLYDEIMKNRDDKIIFMSFITNINYIFSNDGYAEN